MLARDILLLPVLKELNNQGLRNIGEVAMQMAFMVSDWKMGNKNIRLRKKLHLGVTINSY